MDVAIGLLMVIVFASAPFWLDFLLGPRGRRLVTSLRKPEAPAPPAPRRAIEAIAEDVRCRGAKYHDLPEHASYVRRAALASAYDLVLGECCESLGQAHLLKVVPPGADLDRERTRVELVLQSFGMPVAPAA